MVQSIRGSTLFSLTETSASASYNALLRSRSKKEETLLELLQIQRSSGLDFSKPPPVNIN